MKSRFTVILLFLATILLAGCGSAGGPGKAVIEGPDINLAKAQELRINHIYIKDWIGEGTRPFPSVYLQDAQSEEYLVCAGPDHGLDAASEAGIYYGNLDVPMVPIKNATDHNTPVFNIVIVANQDDPCPSPIAADDQIIGSVRLNFSELLDIPIEIGGGTAYVTFKGRGFDDVDVPELEAALTDSLVVGEISFKDTPAGDIIPNYYLVLYISDGAVFRFHSMIDPEDMPEMRESDLIYSKLNLDFSDTDGISSDNNLLKTKARIELQRDDAVVVGKTDADYIGDIIGQKVEFTTGEGYIKFRRSPE